MVVFAVGIGRRIMGLRKVVLPMFITHALSRLTVQRQLRNGPAYVPAATPSHAMGAVEIGF
jgi:hypothetical protein